VSRKKENLHHSVLHPPSGLEPHPTETQTQQRQTSSPLKHKHSKDRQAELFKMNSLYVKTRPENGKTQPYSIAKQNREYLFLPELN